jgi:hypothetical protein
LLLSFQVCWVCSFLLLIFGLRNCEFVVESCPPGDDHQVCMLLYCIIVSMSMSTLNINTYDLIGHHTVEPYEIVCWGYRVTKFKVHVATRGHPKF